MVFSNILFIFKHTQSYVIPAYHVFHHFLQLQQKLLFLFEPTNMKLDTINN
jgi:hypothetical protein